MDIQTAILWSAAVSVVLTMLARLFIQATFKRHIHAFSQKGRTGAEAVKEMLEHFSVENIQIVQREGLYNDCYVPKLHALMISSGAWASTQIAAVASLLFETARAVQYQRGLGYILSLRRLLIKSLYLFCYVSVGALVVLCIMGRFDLLGYPAAVLLLSFLIAVLFLPLDFQTVRLAKEGIKATGTFQGQELQVANKVLSACAFTYVASSYNAFAKIIEIPKGFMIRRYAIKSR